MKLFFFQTKNPEAVASGLMVSWLKNTLYAAERWPAGNDDGDEWNYFH
jgi:hypothetical protein